MLSPYRAQLFQHYIDWASTDSKSECAAFVKKWPHKAPPEFHQIESLFLQIESRDAVDPSRVDVESIQPVAVSTAVEVQRLRKLIEDTAKEWQRIEGIPFEGGIDAAMRAGVDEIVRLRAQVKQLESDRNPLLTPRSPEPPDASRQPATGRHSFDEWNPSNAPQPLAHVSAPQAAQVTDELPYGDAVREILDQVKADNCGKLDARWQEMVAVWEATSSELAQVKTEKDGAYQERDRLVCALSKLFPAWLAQHSYADISWDKDWRWIVFVQLPTGQVSWHIHVSERDWFDHLPVGGPPWDGHTTAEKYRRVAVLSPKPSTGWSGPDEEREPTVKADLFDVKFGKVSTPPPPAGDQAAKFQWGEWTYEIATLKWGLSDDVPARIYVRRTHPDGRTALLGFDEPFQFVKAQQDEISKLKDELDLARAEVQKAQCTTASFRTAIQMLGGKIDQEGNVTVHYGSPPADVLGEKFHTALGKARQDDDVPASIYNAVKHLSDVVTGLLRRIPS